MQRQMQPQGTSLQGSDSYVGSGSAGSMQGGQGTVQSGMTQPPTQGTGLRLQDVETPQQRAVLDGTARAIEVCEWCADQCIQLADPNMIECIRLCRDVSELGRTVLALVPRQSRHVQTTLQAFQQAVQQCAQECGHHDHAHCQECAQVLDRTADSIQQYLGAGGHQTGGFGQQTGTVGQQVGGFGPQGGEFGQQTGQIGQQTEGFGQQGSTYPSPH